MGYILTLDMMRHTDGFASIVVMALLGLATLATVANLSLGLNTDTEAHTLMENLDEAKNLAQSCLQVELLRFIQTQDLPETKVVREIPVGVCLVCGRGQGSHAGEIAVKAQQGQSTAVFLAVVREVGAMPVVVKQKLLSTVVGTCLE